MITNNRLNTLSLRAIGAALLLAVPVGTLASDESDDIIVQPTAAMAQWQADTTRDLNRALAAGGVRYRGSPNDSIVQITFTLGEDGKADNVELYKDYNDSANWLARKMAVRAVKRLDGLDQVPVSNPQDARFLANIIFASNERVHEKLEERLEQSERARLASAGKGRTYLALRN